MRKYLVLLLTGLLLASCSYEEVEVTEVKELEFTEFKNNSIKLKGLVKVNNPNTYPVKIKAVDAEIFVNGSRTGKVKLVNTIKIPSHFNDFVDIEIDTNIEGGSLNILPIALGAALSKQLEVRVRGDMKASTFIFGRKIEFDYTDTAKF